ncbi:MAG: HD domain-containing protein [Candidatus Eisenbacteria bacterium]|uniref:HD domain-containing protein n=1 Tax=Eiseniibacteriota bacterium TaxID=2212470 RepID=A0A7Y2E9X3_UNCEI|nr:HD domain-containing protein [Candidatus Eisenbacteria bacterium]
MALTKTVRDPVHGDIRVHESDLKLLDTPEMQRMRGIKQLGTAYHVYPSAQHTRFEHMLGAYHVAGNLIERIRENHQRDPKSCRGISPKEASIIRVVALLHDVTHIPHGHAIEDQDGLFPRHDKKSLLKKAVTEGELGRVLKRRRLAQVVGDHLSDTGGKNKGTAFLSQVVNGHVGADILDYLKRDAYFTGLRIGYDDRLFDYIKVDPKSGQVYVDLVKHDMDREDILTEVLNLLHCRYVSSERIYYHHAKVASGALLSRAVEIAVMGGLRRKDVEGTTDASLLTLLRDRPYDDHSLGSAKEVSAMVGDLLDRFETRRLPKRCFVATRLGNEKRQDALVQTFLNDATARRSVEVEIAKKLGLKNPLGVIVYCPNKNMQLKEAAVPVRRAGKGIKPLTKYQEDFPILRQVVEAYRDLWKLYVFIPEGGAEDQIRAGRVAERILRQRFPGIKNQYRP